MRYIPGNIWQFLGMAELAAEEGVPRLVTLTSIVLHQAISTAVGIVLAALYFAVAGAGAVVAPGCDRCLWFAPLGSAPASAAHPGTRVLNWAMAQAAPSRRSA